MKSLFPTKRNPFYIWTPPYTQISAGVRCLHLLCHWLNRSGEQAYVALTHRNTGAETHPDLLTPILNQRIVDWHFEKELTPIVVYPEVISGNPAKAERVVRYALNFPGLLGGDSGFPKDDLVFGFSRQLAASCGFPENVLHIPALDTDVFYVGDVQPRHGACFYAAKFQEDHAQQVFDLPPDAVEITRGKPTSQSPQKIAELFRSSEIFYCFENTALAIEAVLCGCPAVFMPNKYLDRPIALDELGWDGFAWGNSEAEIVRARATVARGISNYQRTVDDFPAKLAKFILSCTDYVKKKSYQQKISFNAGDVNRHEIVNLLRQKRSWKLMEKVSAIGAILFS